MIATLGGLIVMFAAISIVPFMMWSAGRGRLAQVRSLVNGKPWPVLKSYTAGNRGYLQLQIADRLVTLSYGHETGTPALIVRVELPPPRLPRFEVMARVKVGVLRAELFPGADIALGNAGFDRRFRVRAHDADATRALWTPELCARFSTELHDASVRVDDEALILGLDPMDPPRESEAAVKLALDIACAGVYGLEALRALPGATPRLDEAGVHVEVEGPSPIRFRPVRSGARMFTMATVDEGVLPTPHPDTAPLGPVTIAPGGSGITILWPEIETDRARLVAAIELLRNVGGAPHDGAYR
jgi:hypothetical protein